MQWFAKAPSNIALIKYMGKENSDSNLPDNPSLSYTLNHLQSTVVLEWTNEDNDSWAPLLEEADTHFCLSAPAQARFLKHLHFLKQQFDYTGHFKVRSNNNFPHSSGLASSASSFAALTQCAVLALSELTNTPMPDVITQAKLSRLGSGSSCRSFFSNWALWEGEDIKGIDLPYQHLIHQVIVISKEEKEISSSEAHRRVRTSPLYQGRSDRAKERLAQLLMAFSKKQWEILYRICWDEFQDMHRLFATASMPFGYMNEKTHEVLALLEAQWASHGDGPLVTMDAGPNIHLLYRDDQKDLAKGFQNQYLHGRYDVL